jgi:hypothetical protein
MSLPARWDRVLRPERTIQEMTSGERRAGHACDSRDASTERGGVRAAPAHAEREHTIEHCRRYHKTLINKKLRQNRGEHTCGDEGLGRRLASEMGERERRTDAFECAEIPEDHRGLAGPEAEYGVVRLAPFVVEQSCAAGRVRARWALSIGCDATRQKKKTPLMVSTGVVFRGEVGGYREVRDKADEADVRIHILWRFGRGPT